MEEAQPKKKATPRENATALVILLIFAFFIVGGLIEFGLGVRNHFRHVYALRNQCEMQVFAKYPHVNVGNFDAYGTDLNFCTKQYGIWNLSY